MVGTSRAAAETGAGVTVVLLDTIAGNCREPTRGTEGARPEQLPHFLKTDLPGLPLSGVPTG